MKKQTKRKSHIDCDSETSSSEGIVMEFQDSDDSMIFGFDTNEDEDCVLVNSIKEDDFAIVKFLTKKTTVCYVSRVMNKPEDGDVQMQFLRRKGNSTSFIYPINEE